MQGSDWLLAAVAVLLCLVLTARLLADAELLAPSQIRSPRGLAIGGITVVLALVALAPTGVPAFGAGNLAAAGVAVVTAPLFLIDQRDHRLPNPITYSLIGLALLLGVVSALATGNWNTLTFALTWGLIPFAFLLLMVLLSRGGVGMGDAKLAAGLGLVSALTSGRLVLTSMAAAFLIGGLWALSLLLLRKANRKTEIAFGPFLLAGFWLAYLLLR